MEMNKFYKNLDFDGGLIEESNAQDFADKCAREGMIFLDDKAFIAPQTLTKNQITKFI